MRVSILPIQVWRSIAHYYFVDYYVVEVVGKLSVFINLLQWIRSFILEISHQHNAEAATGGVLWEKLFLEILQNLQENTFAKVSFLIMLQAWDHKDSCLRITWFPGKAIRISTRTR